MKFASWTICDDKVYDADGIGGVGCGNDWVVFGGVIGRRLRT